MIFGEVGVVFAGVGEEIRLPLRAPALFGLGDGDDPLVEAGSVDVLICDGTVTEVMSLEGGDDGAALPCVAGREGSLEGRTGLWLVPELVLTGNVDLTCACSDGCADGESGDRSLRMGRRRGERVWSSCERGAIPAIPGRRWVKLDGGVGGTRLCGERRDQAIVEIGGIDFESACGLDVV